jgi:hypothetical protein
MVVGEHQQELDALAAAGLALASAGNLGEALQIVVEAAALACGAPLVIARVGDETATLGPGEAVLAPAGLDHGVENPGPGRAALLVFMAPRP